MEIKRISKSTVLLIAILLLYILISVANVAYHFPSKNSLLSFNAKEDTQWVYYHVVAPAQTPAFKRGENVLILFRNYEDSPVELPNDTPWWIETNTSSGWTTVYTPLYGDTKMVIYPQEYRGTTKETQAYWMWNLTFSNGSLLPEGYYRIVLPTNRCIYYQEFIISDIYGKLGWLIVDDILNSSVSMNKTYDVELYLRAKNLTSDLIEYLHMKIGNFSVKAVINSSKVSSHYNYSILFATLQKYQILAAIKLSIVDLIVLEQQGYELLLGNDTNSTNNQTEDNRILEYSI